MVTISTHNGSQAHRDHNIRNEKVVSKEEHIQENGHYEIWKDETPRQAYHKLFDKSVERYNAKQTREDRKITNYYSQIEKDAKKHPVYEMIIGVYPGKDEAVDVETQRAILKEFVDNWQVRNPNLYLCGAYFHNDEQGEPHCHIDYIPVARGYTKGMDTQTGLVKALEQQGIIKVGKLTAQIQWEHKENEYLEKLCQARGLEVAHPTEEHREHLRTDLYKAQMELDTLLEHTRDLLNAEDDIRADIGKLEATRDKAEKQAEKAIERKQRAFSRSWKKDKEAGWNYDKGLEKEIRSLVKERKADVEAISHTDLDVQREYDEARAYRATSNQEADRAKARAEQELAKAKELRDNAEAHIQRRAEYQARQMFNSFIREQGLSQTDRAKRLEEHCKNVTYQDGSSVLDKFNAKEKQRIADLTKKYEEHTRSRGWGMEL